MSITKNTEKVIDSSFVFDASSSWNGFNHQGKLAIYECLKTMEPLSFDELKDYRLEIEHLEDFSILKNDKYLTVHQVKSYKENSAHSHKEAIWNLMGIMNNFSEIHNSYLHVTSEITDINNLKSILIKEMNSVFDEKDVKKGVNKKSPGEHMIDVKKSNSFDNLFKKFKVYEYPDKNKFCGLDKIDDLVKDQIRKCKKKGTTAEDINRTFYHILGIIDKNIRENHHNIQTTSKTGRKKIYINFIEIFEVLSTNYENFSLEYASIILKSEFERIIREYLRKKDDAFSIVGNKEDYQNTLVVTKNILAQINKLSAEEIVDFCLIINPTNQINKDIHHSTPNLLFLMSESNIEYSFLAALKIIKNQLIENKWVYIIKNDAGENISYLPSTIINPDLIEEYGTISEKILNNPHNEFLREIDVIITKEINNIKISDYNRSIMKNIEDPDQTEDEKKYFDKINKIKNIKMINLNHAMEDFKDD